MADLNKPSQVPEWGDDPLSAEYFAQAHYNERAASLNYPKVYDLMQRVNALFVSAAEAVERDNNEVLLLPRLFLIRTRAAFLAASRLAMAGQMPESFPILRLAIELAWYALHIAKDPSPSARAAIWLKRGEAKSETQACKNEFKIANVRATHVQIDPAHESHMHQLYESMIDLGAHPNQLGLFSSVGSESEGNSTTYRVGILYPKEFPLLATLGMAMAVAYDVLRTFQLIFPERFEIMGVGTQLSTLLVEIQNFGRQMQGLEPSA
jgi:hypothetical protein